MDKIRTYKMTHATGFAPNPNCGILTLATCKPGIREKANLGDWIAGFTSTVKTAGGTPRGKEKLIYLMKVTDKMTFKEYWEQYPQKRPEHSKLGDNIYFWDENENKYKQTDKASEHKEEWLQERDKSSDKVLISTEFRYFGKENALDISEYQKDIEIPYGPAKYGRFWGPNEKVTEFINFVMAQEAKSDIDYSASSRKSSNLDSNPKKKTSSCSKK